MCLRRSSHHGVLSASFLPSLEFNARCVLSMCARTFAQEKFLKASVSVNSGCNLWYPQLSERNKEVQGDIEQPWRIVWHPLISENCKFYLLSQLISDYQNGVAFSGSQCDRNYISLRAWAIGARWIRSPEYRLLLVLFWNLRLLVIPHSSDKPPDSVKFEALRKEM